MSTGNYANMNFKPREFSYLILTQVTQSIEKRLDRLSIAITMSFYYF